MKTEAILSNFGGDVKLGKQEKAQMGSFHSKEPQQSRKMGKQEPHGVQH